MIRLLTILILLGVLLSVTQSPAAVLQSPRAASNGSTTVMKTSVIPASIMPPVAVTQSLVTLRIESALVVMSSTNVTGPWTKATNVTWQITAPNDKPQEFFMLSVEQTFYWDAATNDNVAGYSIITGPRSHDYNHVFDVGNVTNATIVLDTLAPTYVTAQTYSADGQRSDYCPEIIVNVPALPAYRLPPIRLNIKL